MPAARLAGLFGMTWNVLAAFQQAGRRCKAAPLAVDNASIVSNNDQEKTASAVTSGMAHNLNNIIAAIAGFNAMIEMNVDEDSLVAQSTKDITVSVQRAKRLIDEMLNLGLQSSLSLGEVDVAHLLADTKTMLSVTLPDTVIVEVTQLEDQSLIAADFDRLQQVLLNICNNAAQAMPAGGTIQIDAKLVALSEPHQASDMTVDAGRYVVINISDNGIGMSPVVMARIFEPYFTTRARGAGLGLTTAHEIVESHRGAIDVRSLLGGGTSFTLWLPLDDAPSSLSEEAISATGDRIVLIVNADATQRARDEEIVAELGYEPAGLSDLAHIGEFEDRVDIVLIAGTHDEALSTALEVFRKAGWRIPLLVAASRPSVFVPIPSLRYPLVRTELRALLAQSTELALDAAEGSHVVADRSAPTSWPQAVLTPSHRPSRKFALALLPVPIAAFFVTVAIYPSLRLRPWATNDVAPKRERVAGQSARIETARKPVLQASSQRMPQAPKPFRDSHFSEHHMVVSLAVIAPEVADNTGYGRKPGIADVTHATFPGVRHAWIAGAASSSSARLMSIIKQQQTILCRRYTGSHWKTIGVIAAPDCIRRAEGKHKPVYLQLGSDLLTIFKDRIFIYLNGKQRALRLALPWADAATKPPRPSIVLASTDTKTCRRFNGLSWRPMGSLTTRHCAELAFAQPGTGFVRSGELELSRRANRIGVSQGTKWRAIAKVDDHQTLGMSVQLTKL